MNQSKKGIDLVYQDTIIRRKSETGLVSLTDMWKAEGRPKEKSPMDWVRLESTVELLTHISRETGVNLVYNAKGEIKCIPGVLESKCGGISSGIYAIPQLAIAYAQILSVEFYQWALTALVERIEEENNPEQALSRGYERAVKGWKKQGYSDSDIEVLTQCVIARKDLTGTMQAHGIEDQKTWPYWLENERMAYANATNQVYKPLLGCTAKEYREKHKLKSSTNVREHLTQQGQIVKRAAIMLAETIARESIKDGNLYGFPSCKTACGDAGKKVSRIFE